MVRRQVADLDVHFRRLIAIILERSTVRVALLEHLHVTRANTVRRRESGERVLCQDKALPCGILRRVLPRHATVSSARVISSSIDRATCFCSSFDWPEPAKLN